ncbi:polysaccharide pyruvyl transferase family protein [Jannaschia aquimarina]|uniref:Polysaccharide pyruvyl transferase n=1 Tax=Jannaschia aquimarina TaxID=935700 RepID=A0A0D1EI22_9RHOB|nr:polysaccharide pyruvyl transferase family protein [Jannaschia aquimarina]KIT15495.1 Polysaccharide pyruvyl transferase [Jannaschia aquimarina]SNT34134.1 Polysaccharide pyruvyl transferase [Jannaschia aquimarina]
MIPAVVLNDTRPDHHHGCARVMSVLERRLAKVGIGISAYGMVGLPWRKQPAVVAALPQARLVIVNGEGTLHHGSWRGADLLSIAEAPEAARARCVLVNALFQDNPASWRAPLDRFDLVSLRDERSAAHYAELTGRTGRVVPDLTLCDGVVGERPGKRDGLIFGDSVDPDVTATLWKTARQIPGARIVPTVTVLKRPKGRNAATRALRGLYSAAYRHAVMRRFPSLEVLQDEASYAAALRSADLHATGRFHGLCFSLITGTPALAVASNSWKIAALLEDAGLRQDRQVAPEAIAAAVEQPGDWAYDTTERAALDEFLANARRKADALFNDIANLVA